ncbi:MAG: OmpA family protein [Gammaproteobacteria bacterium]|nr:OmpA family protein [Gammaproteobacteria bacterium]
MSETTSVNQMENPVRARRVSRSISCRAARYLGLAVLGWVAVVQASGAAPDASVDRTLWYAGVAAGISQLKPESTDPSIRRTDVNGTYAGFLVGRKLNETFALEAQLHLPGRGEVGGADVDYSALDLAMRYRLIEGRAAGGRTTEVFALAGFGSINRDADATVDLDNDTRFHFAAGLGAEVFVGPAVSLRLQALYLDDDVQLGNLALVWHWGTASTAPKLRTGAAASGSTAPVAVQPAVEPARSAARKPDPATDADADGVSDSSDLCADSAIGYPVRENGCALFEGVLPGISFADQSSTLTDQSYAQLDALADKLRTWPDATVVLIAHTDNRATVREQAILTRARLKTIATYLSRNGVAAKRLILKSMGGSRPLYDNTTDSGRQRNNRVEIRELRS